MEGRVLHRWFPAVWLALLALAAFSTTTATSSAQMRTLWEYSDLGLGPNSLFGVDSSTQTLAASTNNAKGIIGVDAETGAVKWNWTPPKGSKGDKGNKVVQMQVRKGVVLVVSVVPGGGNIANLDSLTAHILTASTGAPLLNYKFEHNNPYASYAVGENQFAVIYFQQITSFYFNGTLAFNTTVPDRYGDLRSVNLGKDIVLCEIQTLNYATVSFDLKTGKLVCQAVTHTDPRLLAGNAFVDSRANSIVDGNAPDNFIPPGPHGIPFCKNKTHLPRLDEADIHTTRVIGDSMIEFEKDGTTRCYKDGTFAWRNKLPNGGKIWRDGKFVQEDIPIEVTRIADNSEAIALNIHGNFSIFNNTNGETLWAPSPGSEAGRLLPYQGLTRFNTFSVGAGTFNANPPLALHIGAGSRYFFVANLQGWNILDTAAGDVVYSTMNTPISGAFGHYSAAREEHIVMFLELETGTLKGLTWSDSAGR